MKFIKSPLIITTSILLLLNSGNIMGQKLNDIINKHIEAIGGKSTLKSINTIYTEGKVMIDGLDIYKGPFETYLINGNGFLINMDFGTIKISDCYTRTNAWMINSAKGKSKAEALSEEDMKAGSYLFFVGDALLNDSTNGETITLLGNEKYEEFDVYSVKVTSITGWEIVYLIDSKSYYILKAITRRTLEGKQVEFVTNYYDYLKTDFGYIAPSNYQLAYPGGTPKLNFSINQITINQSIDLSKFNMPK